MIGKIKILTKVENIDSCDGCNDKYTTNLYVYVKIIIKINFRKRNEKYIQKNNYHSDVKYYIECSN